MVFSDDDCAQVFTTAQVRSEDLIGNFFLARDNSPNFRPAIKVCTDPVVIQTLACEGVNFDCSNKWEIEAVVNAGIDPCRIIYANPAKQTSHLEFAKDVGPPYDRPRTHLTTVWGATCHPLDVLEESVPFFEVSVNEWLVVDNVGAYGMVKASGFNGTGFPPVHYITSVEDAPRVAQLLEASPFTPGYSQPMQAARNIGRSGLNPGLESRASGEQNTSELAYVLFVKCGVPSSPNLARGLLQREKRDAESTSQQTKVLSRHSLHHWGAENRIRRYNENHILCRQPESACQPVASGVGDADKDIILAAHNRYRSQIAIGNNSRFPYASNMLEMEWDDDLARVAQAHANLCTSQPSCSSCMRIAGYAESVLEAGQSAEMTFERPIQPSSDGRLCVEVEYNKGPNVAGTPDRGLFNLIVTPVDRPERQRTINLSEGATNMMRMRITLNYNVGVKIGFSFVVPGGSPAQYVNIHKVAVYEKACSE
ncbi:hypothetical protein MTO96_021448 [Rhipicephalus appendiculatus]